MSERPDTAITLDKPDVVTVADVRSVRDGSAFVPGFTDKADPTHLTTGFLKMTALCGHYPVEIIGDSPSGVWCADCVAEAKARTAG
jgi:hypothetical protein